MGIGGYRLTLCRSGHTLELTDVSVTHCIVIFRRAITSVCVLEMESVVAFTFHTGCRRSRPVRPQQSRHSYAYTFCYSGAT